MSVKMAIEAQGRIFAIANKAKPTRVIGGKRGDVRIFTPAARNRLMRKAARIQADRAVFMTLTYPDHYPSPFVAKAHLKAFLEVFRRAFPRAAAVWRIEAQQRGAPHFHLLWYNLPYIRWTTVERIWHRIIRAHAPIPGQGVDLQFCDNPRKVARYISKYIAKTADADPWCSGRIYSSAYPHVGRHWGIHNKAYIPWADRLYIVLNMVSDEDFSAVKTIMRREWEYLCLEPDRGGTIFTDEAQNLFDLAMQRCCWLYSRVVTNGARRSIHSRFYEPGWSQGPLNSRVSCGENGRV